jgi:3-isopropylmalate dehydrogenase
VLSCLREAGCDPIEVVAPAADQAELIEAAAIPKDAVGFCHGIFAGGGAVLTGPGGGRYVHDLRSGLDLFLKISPIQTRNGLPEASPLRRARTQGVDLLVLRENTGGIYQGHSRDDRDADGRRRVSHSFSYAERDVRRFVDAAARLARARRGLLTVVAKEGGVPAVSRLWRDCAAAAADAHGIDCSIVDSDLVAYQLVSRPHDFDVVAAPNLYGDVLSDLAAVLLGSRGLSYSGNFNPRGDAVYQTNHGAAHDIAGTDRANPIAQILSLAMMLRESFGMWREARAIEEGIRNVWSQGWRTSDLDGTSSRVVGTQQMAKLIGEAAARPLAYAGPGEEHP